jgi:hypothetical protein
MTDTIDAVEVVETTGTEIEPYRATLLATLFGNDPRLAVEHLADVAKVIDELVTSQGLFAPISGRRYWTAEAWSAAGVLVGVTPVVCWVRPNETGDGFVARVEARTLDGRVVGAAESECSRAERRWKTREPFQLRSMAQTRGVSRALRAALAVIPVLAGYEPGSSEEMADVVVEPELGEAEPAEPVVPKPTRAQMRRIGELIAGLTDGRPDVDWKAKARELAGCPGDKMTPGVATIVIDKLEEILAELRQGA